jgi:hypothetical protein
MSKSDLTSEQINTLKSLLVQRKVDNMQTPDLIDYVTSDLTWYYDSLLDNEFLQEAKDYLKDDFLNIIKDIKHDEALNNEFLQEAKDDFLSMF